jgi:hypothetical protein
LEAPVRALQVARVARRLPAPRFNLSAAPDLRSTMRALRAAMVALLALDQHRFRLQIRF